LCAGLFERGLNGDRQRVPICSLFVRLRSCDAASQPGALSSPLGDRQNPHNSFRFKGLADARHPQSSRHNSSAELGRERTRRLRPQTVYLRGSWRVSGGLRWLAVLATLASNHVAIHTQEVLDFCAEHDISANERTCHCGVAVRAGQDVGPYKRACPDQAGSDTATDEGCR
jgi:hypothetical protein